MSKNSWTDWDFETENWVMSREQYKAAPCSLHVTQAERMYVFVKTSVVPVASVKEGRMVLWFRHGSSGPGDSIVVDFRYQDANNRYAIHLRPGADLCYFVRVYLGVHKTFQTATWAYALNTWHKVRITWWNDPECDGIFARLERWNDSAWVNVIEWGYDPDGRWSDTGGRIGFSNLNNTVYIDDMELYGVI